MNSSEKQNEAFEKLSKLKVGALFMDMGTGKTKVALDLIAYKRKKVDYVLWVCPYSIKNEIIKEKEKWYPDLDMDVVGCESIGQSDRIYLETLDNVKSKKTFMVVDESLKIKNIGAKRTKRILSIGEHTEYRLILNGTPISKSVLDIYTQMEFLSPKILNMSYLEFKDNYCEYYTSGRLKGKVRKTHNTDHLASLIEPYIFDAKLDIAPKKKWEKVYYSTNLQAYRDFKNEIFWEYYNPDDDDLNFGAFAMRLQRWYTQNSTRGEELQSLIKEINDKVVVFVKFLDSIPGGAHSITGSDNEEVRRKTIENFRNGEFNVLYITYGCGSFGLNLQFCKNMIFSEQVFDYAQVDQAEHRIYRMGQESDVCYYRLICDGVGLEEKIEKNIDKKGDLLQTVKEEIQKMKGGVKEWVKTI